MVFIGKPSIEEGFNEFKREIVKRYPHYDFSEVVYKDRSTKVKVKCNIHNVEFYVEPRFLLKDKRVCPQCQKRMNVGISIYDTSDYVPNKHSDTTESFITKSKKIFNNTFDYSKVVYGAGQHCKVELTCIKHSNTFITTANSHLNKKYGGCKECDKEGIRIVQSGDRAGLPRKYGIQDFITKANIVHNNKYDYTFSTYDDATTKVLIVCPTHGGFRAIAGQHLFGDGCYKCSLTTYIGSTEEFIELCRLKHEDKYIYDKIDYITQNIPIEVVCKIHGSWFPLAGNFKSGSGCPYCNNTEARFSDLPTSVYYIKYKDKYKIGVTTKSVLDRFRKDIPKENLHNLKIIFQQEFSTGMIAYDIEQKVLSKYQEYRYRGHMIFRKTRNTEVFTEDVLGLDVCNKERSDYFNKLIEEGLDEAI